MKSIHISKVFTNTPGARYKVDGRFSGEEFREKFLEPEFKDPSNNEEITINFDGALGYATSFLEEAFGGLSRMYGKNRCFQKLRFISMEDLLLTEEVRKYIENANEE